MKIHYIFISRFKFSYISPKVLKESLDTRFEKPKSSHGSWWQTSISGFFIIIVMKTYEFGQPYSIKHYSWLNLPSIQPFRTYFLVQFYQK